MMPLSKKENKINLHSSKGKWSDDSIANIVPPLRVGVNPLIKYQTLDDSVKNIG